MNEPNKRCTYVCQNCGSNRVTRDAWAEWDVEMQQWSLGSIYDQAFCHRCEVDTRLVEVELKP